MSSAMSKTCVCVHALVIPETKQALEGVTVTLGVLQEGTEQLQSNLSKIRLDISNTLDDPVCTRSPEPVTHVCINIHTSLSQLEIDANYSSVRFSFSEIYEILS